MVCHDHTGDISGTKVHPFPLVVLNETAHSMVGFAPQAPCVYLLLAVLRKCLVFSQLKMIQVLMRSQWKSMLCYTAIIFTSCQIA